MRSSLRCRRGQLCREQDGAAVTVACHLRARCTFSNVFDNQNRASEWNKQKTRPPRPFGPPRLKSHRWHFGSRKNAQPACAKPRWPMPKAGRSNPRHLTRRKSIRSMSIPPRPPRQGQEMHKKHENSSTAGAARKGNARAHV